MRRRKDPFEKPWVIIAAVAGVIAVIVIALIFFMGDGTPEPASPGEQSANPVSPGQSSVVGVAPSAIKTQVPVTVPTQGVFVRVNYIGGFAGEYGMEGNMTATRNSGDRFFEVENATGTVTATFHKEDSSSRHDITVEIYRNGQSLQSASNTSSYGEASVTAAV